MGPVTITLSEPIEAHGQTIEQLVIEPPRGKHLRALPVKQRLDMGDLLDLAGACTGLPPSAMDQLSAADVLAVVEAMGNFLGGAPGGTQSS